jgi:hypothetical protein
MVTITSHVAERIVDEILSSHQEEEEGLLAITIIDERGLGGRARGRGGKDNVVLATKAKESFRKAFGSFYRQAGVQYDATLALAALGVANEIREYAGQVQSIITTYEKFKMTLLPMPAYDIVVGLVLSRFVKNAEDYSKNISREIERLLLTIEEQEDTLKRNNKWST